MEKLRKAGIEMMGDISWGTHFCQFYQTKEDLMDILVPYFKSGLENNEYCIWVTSKPLGKEDVLNAMKKALPNFDQHLKKGQIEILPHTQWYLKGGKFDSKRVLNGWVDRCDQALAKGYEGLRLTGNTFWLEKKDWRKFTDYEQEVNNLIKKYHMIAICTYSLDKCGTNEVIDVISNHQFTLIKRQGKWNLIESSERRRAEESLRFEKQFSELLINSSFDGILAFDREYRYTVWNREMERISGISRSETLGKYAFDVFPSLKETGEDKYFFEALEGKTIIAKDRPYKVPATNQEGFFEGYYSPIRNESGEIIGGLAIIHDITTHKRAEEALKESEMDLNHAQAVAHTGSWRLDVLRNELLWSDETHRIFGIPKETPLTYEAFLATVHPEDRQFVDQSWRAALRGQPYDIEHRIVVESAVKWVHERAELEFDGKGILLGGFGTVQDITEHKQMEEELRRSHDELEIRVQERTYDLNERVKELNCLSLVSSVFNKPDIPFEKVFEEIVIMLPSAFQFPEIVCARITLRGQEFKTQNYRETAAWKLKSEILSRGKPMGIIELNYLEEKPVCYEGPFLREEKIIINAIALQLGEYIERIEMQTELAEQRRILEGFFTSTITPLVFLDKDFNFIRVNEAYAKGCQRDVSEFPGHNHFEFYPHEENEAIFRRVVETKVPFQTFGKPFAFPDHPEWGTTYWDWTLTPILDQKGEVEFLVFSLEDVTDRMRAEQNVRENEQHLRVALATTNIAVFNQDRKLRYTWMYQPQLGYSVEQVIGKTDSELLPPGDAQGLMEIKRRVIESGRGTREEVSVTQNDRKLYYDLTLEPLFDSTGAVVGLNGAMLDITRRKKGQEVLHEQAMLLDLAYDAIFVRNMEGKIRLWSRGAEEMYGWKKEEAMGRVAYELLHTQFPSSLDEIITETIHKDRWEGELVHTGKDGKRIVVASRWALQRDSKGNSIGILEINNDITARKRAEEAAEAERQRLNDVLEILPVYLVLLTPDYHVSFANRFFREHFGESHGRRCFEYLFGRSEPCEICDPYKVLKTKAPHEWEWTGLDGRNYHVFGFPFTDTDGSTLILEMGVDITERKRAEEQFKAASLYAKSLIEASLDPLVTISRNGKIMDVNRATELSTGVHRKQLIGSDFSDYFTEPEKAKKGYEEVFSKGFVTDYPLAIRNISGKVNKVLYNAAVYKDEHGEVQGVFAAARDITERKQIEDSLREREALLRTIFETLPVGVWITDKNGVITQGNPAGQQIWAGVRYVGIDQFGEFKGWWVDTGKPIEPEEWAAARAVLKGETSINEEIEIECFDGSHKIILNSAFPIRDERQEILGTFIVNQDITERKRAEKALRQIHKMEALGTLAGGIAHDFNNILMPIVINTELALLDTPENSPTSNYLKLIQEAANRGKDLIKQIITFSRQKEQVKAPIEIGPVIKEALKFLRSSIPKTIEMREHIEAAHSMILGDPTQIHQVLMNLCSNASYAMREKGGVLDVSLTPVEVDAEMVNRHLDLKPGSYLRLTVADTGQGMNKEIMERIFDPFFTTKKLGEGTGMGLAVVHGIVKNHGGAIIVYSEVGKGSTFNVFLPMIKEELKAETAPLETITTGGERILLIDDEEIQIRSVQPMLERLGYEVIGKTDALESLGVFKTQPDAFDLVITDQTMPRMTGRELAEEILRIRPDIPIILCTGFSEVIHEEEAKAKGIREFVMKPFSVSEMAERIRKALGRNI